MSKIYEGRKEFTNYLKLSRPKDDLYKTVSKKKPFSLEYQIKVPYGLYATSFASVVGTAFDYVARFMIARTIKNNKEAVLDNLAAERGIESFNAIEQEFINDKFEFYLEEMERYIYGDNEVTLKDVTRMSCFFARLEHAARTKWIPNEETINYIHREDSEILKEVNQMGVVFYDDFISRGMVKENSDVVFNPTFGVCTEKLKGADGDVFIDGVLWDFKTTKSNIKKTEDFTQMWQYLVYDMACKMASDDTYCLKNKEIKAIAFYKARFGEIEFLKMKDINVNQLYAVARTVIMILTNIEQCVTIDDALMLTNRHKVFTTTN